METNQVQITTMLQFHITFTLPSITLRLHATAVISQQRPVTLLSYPLTYGTTKKVEDTIWKQINYKLPQCYNFTLPSP